MIDRRNLFITASAVLAAAPAVAQPYTIKVYKDPSCGCCTVWVKHLAASGFKTVVEASADMAAVKAKYGVPDDLMSCHTGIVGGYAIEGHVPAADIKKLLKARSKGAGLAVPGMPLNSHGMEVPGEANERYTVWLFQKDGERSAFATHG